MLFYLFLRASILNLRNLHQLFRHEYNLE